MANPRKTIGTFPSYFFLKLIFLDFVDFFQKKKEESDVPSPLNPSSHPPQSSIYTPLPCTCSWILISSSKPITCSSWKPITCSSSSFFLSSHGQSSHPPISDSKTQFPLQAFLTYSTKMKKVKSLQTYQTHHHCLVLMGMKRFQTHIHHHQWVEKMMRVNQKMGLLRIWAHHFCMMGKRLSQ